MVTTLKDLGKNLGRAWENLAEGWAELVNRSSNALTRYVSQKDEAPDVNRDTSIGFPSWAIIAGEVMETKNSIIVKVEMPGIEREDCDITVEGDVLRIRGEKRVDREHVADTYYLMERAYGSFERVIPLPSNVDPDGAKAFYKSGVLTVELPKTTSSTARRVTVH